MKTKFNFFTLYCMQLIPFTKRGRPALFSLFLLFSLPIQARDDSLTLPLSRGKNILHIELNTGYYYTEENYGKNFQAQSLRQALKLAQNNDAPFFQYMSAELSMGYSITDWFEIEAFSSGFWYAQSGNGKTLRFSGPQIKRAGVGFRSQQNITQSFGFIPEFSFSFPFFSINDRVQKPITDDGSMHFTPSIWMYGVIGDILYPFAYGGFKFRTNSLSSLLQWKAGLMLKADIAEIGFYSYGFWSAIRDKSSSVLGDRFNLLKRTNAGSLKFYSANPGLIGFAGWLGWHFPHVTLRLLGDIDINGAYHSKGYTFLASLIIELGSKKERVDEIFHDRQEDNFEAQITEDEQSVSDIFENPIEDSRIQEEAEKALEEAAQIEEEKIEQSVSEEE